MDGLAHLPPLLDRLVWDRWAASLLGGANPFEPSAERFASAFFEGPESSRRWLADDRRGRARTLLSYAFTLGDAELVLLEEEKEIIIVAQSGVFSTEKTGAMSLRFAAAKMANADRSDRMGWSRSQPRAYQLKADGSVTSLDVALLAILFKNAPLRARELPRIREASSRVAVLAPMQRVVAVDAKERSMLAERRTFGASYEAHRRSAGVVPVNATRARRELAAESRRTRIGAAARWSSLLTRWVVRAVGVAPEFRNNPSGLSDVLFDHDHTRAGAGVPLVLVHTLPGAVAFFERPLVSQPMQPSLLPMVRGTLVPSISRLGLEGGHDAAPDGIASLAPARSGAIPCSVLPTIMRSTDRTIVGVDHRFPTTRPLTSRRAPLEKMPPEKRIRLDSRAEQAVAWFSVALPFPNIGKIQIGSPPSQALNVLLTAAPTPKFGTAPVFAIALVDARRAPAHFDLLERGLTESETWRAAPALPDAAPIVSSQDVPRTRKSNSTTMVCPLLLSIRPPNESVRRSTIFNVPLVQFVSVAKREPKFSTAVEAPHFFFPVGHDAFAARLSTPLEGRAWTLQYFRSCGVVPDQSSRHGLPESRSSTLIELATTPRMAGSGSRIHCTDRAEARDGKPGSRPAVTKQMRFRDRAEDLDPESDARTRPPFFNERSIWVRAPHASVSHSPHSHRDKSAPSLEMAIVDASPAHPSLDSPIADRPMARVSSEPVISRAAEGVASVSLDGAVDAIAQRIYHRIKRRLISDRERLGG